MESNIASLGLSRVDGEIFERLKMQGRFRKVILLIGPHPTGVSSKLNDHECPLHAAQQPKRFQVTQPKLPLSLPTMPPMTRQDTRTSVFSWWSDSNPLLKGPTINLHAMAKPLMKRMYHRQALEFIRKNEGRPLSMATLETYSSYFP
jgi:hypothetical protein